MGWTFEPSFSINFSSRSSAENGINSAGDTLATKTLDKVEWKLKVQRVDSWCFPKKIIFCEKGEIYLLIRQRSGLEKWLFTNRHSQCQILREKKNKVYIKLTCYIWCALLFSKSLLCNVETSNSELFAGDGWRMRLARCLWPLSSEVRPAVGRGYNGMGDHLGIAWCWLSNFMWVVDSRLWTLSLPCFEGFSPGSPVWHLGVEVAFWEPSHIVCKSESRIDVTKSTVLQPPRDANGYIRDTRFTRNVSPIGGGEGIRRNRDWW